MKHRRRQVEALESRHLLASESVIISEFMASNRGTSIDGFGESSDWLEIHNGSDATVDLQGWKLTDDREDLDKWIFSGTTQLAAGEFFVVWASGRDTVEDDGSPHVNFKLSANGEFVALVHPDGTIASSYGADSDYPSQRTDVSYGMTANGEVRFFFAPTPGEANEQGALGVVSDTKFSEDRGFYEDPFTLQITTATPGATLVYTLDGSTPSATHGSQVDGGNDAPTASVRIDKTTTVRAIAYLDGWKSTNVDTQTYLFLEQVIRQSGDDLPDTWGHNGADYEMDPEVVDDPRYRDSIIDGLRSLPTLSLVMELDNWFGENRVGIYPQGQSSPRPVSAELILVDGEEGFQVDAAVEIQGGSSTNRWKSDKLSMQLKFQSQYGAAKLRYPLYGDIATNEFDTLVLDARLNQAWHYGGGVSPTSQRARAQYARDQFVADLQNQLGGQAPNGRWLHVYLNGIYWGIHNLHERPDEHFAAAYFGGDPDDYDVIKHKTDVVNGSYSNYQALIDAVNRDTRNESRYRDIEAMLDIDQLMDYVQTNYFVGNTDWAHHNWYATFNKNSADGKWRFHSWDAEHVLENLNDDATGRDNEKGPTHIHRRLMRNEEYRLKFMDTVQENFFNHGLFTPTKAIEIYQHRLDEVNQAVVPESARWGDNQRSRPYTRDVEWIRERDRLLKDYFPARTDIVIEQLRDQEFFHRFDAPRFNQPGGEVPTDFLVVIQGSGDIYYTLDGTDPRQSETRFRYSTPIPISELTPIRTRTLVDGQWSAIVEATFETHVRGDFSSDHQLDATDIDLLFAAIEQNTDAPVFDLNEDSKVDQQDVDYWVDTLANTRHGDANLDGRVDFTDFLVLSANFEKTDAGWSDGDFSGDGVVTFADFLILSIEFGYSVGESE